MIFEIDNVLLSSDIITEMFCCDLDKCHGICCIEGDAGAPVTMDEVAAIEESMDAVWEQLSATAQSVIDRWCVYVAAGLTDLVNSLAPEMILIGGGVSRQGERILAPIREYVAEHCFGQRQGAIPVIAAAKHNSDIAIGNVFGSNIFNVFFVLGTSAAIHPLPAYEGIGLDACMAAMGSIIVWLAVKTDKARKVQRWAGALLLIVYGAYLAYRLWTV